jgi:mannose-6-phosphate isomerase-like protein (cupin superfamily)
MAKSRHEHRQLSGGAMTALDLDKHGLFLDGAGGVEAVPTGPDFYEKIKAMPHLGGTMVSLGLGKGTSKKWEMHPKGEEVLVILEGSPDVLFKHADGREEKTPTRPGQAVIVPRGVWHRTVGTPGWKILYLTYGEGTLHKPV